MSTEADRLHPTMPHPAHSPTWWLGARAGVQGGPGPAAGRPAVTIFLVLLLVVVLLLLAVCAASAPAPGTTCQSATVLGRGKASHLPTPQSWPQASSCDGIKGVEWRGRWGESPVSQSRKAGGNTGAFREGAATGTIASTNQGTALSGEADSTRFLQLQTLLSTAVSSPGQTGWTEFPEPGNLEGRLQHPQPMRPLTGRLSVSPDWECEVGACSSHLERTSKTVSNCRKHDFMYRNLRNPLKPFEQGGSARRRDVGSVIHSEEAGHGVGDIQPSFYTLRTTPKRRCEDNVTQDCVKKNRTLRIKFSKRNIKPIL